jgi:uncharacterized membrane protein YpjA
MTFYYIWFTIFAGAAYFIVTDDSVAAAFYFVFRLAKSYFQRQWWWFLNNPRNPVVKYLMWRRSYKLVKELENELKSNAK